MHDLATIQRMNREATERANEEARAQREARLAAIAESVTEADEVEAARKAAMQRHPAGSARRITEARAMLEAARNGATNQERSDALQGIANYLESLVDQAVLAFGEPTEKGE